MDRRLARCYRYYKNKLYLATIAAFLILGRVLNHTLSSWVWIYLYQDSYIRPWFEACFCRRFSVMLLSGA